MDGAFKVLKLALRIAIAWTLLSVLVTALWALLLEAGRRFGSGAAAKPPAHEERQLSAKLRAIYGNFAVDAEVCGGEPVGCEPDETAGSDPMVRIRATASAGKR